MSEIDSPGDEPQNLLDLTARIVSAFVGQNVLTADALPRVIQDVHKALKDASEESPEVQVTQAPAVAVRKSITPDHLVCLEDGRKLKMLKRYLRTRYEMTPEDYRQKWNLPADYPMVAPNYAAARSDLAKQIGLGRKPKAKASAKASAKAPAKRRARKKAA